MDRRSHDGRCRGKREGRAPEPFMRPAQKAPLPEKHQQIVTKHGRRQD